MSFYSELLKKINTLRKDPSSYVEKILSFKNCFKGKVMSPPGAKSKIVTTEGFSAFEEAANVLKSTKPVGELKPSKALGRIANDYLEVVKQIDPEKIDDIDVFSMVSKYGNCPGLFSNAIDFGSETPELVLINLLVSDGDSTRFNRRFIINPDLKKIGMATGKHDTYDVLTVLFACSEFTNTFDKDDNENYDVLEDNSQKESETLLVNSKKETEEIKTDEPNVIIISKRERIVIDSGIKKRKTIIFKRYKNGKTKKEVKYTPL